MRLAKFAAAISRVATPFCSATHENHSFIAIPKILYGSNPANGVCTESKWGYVSQCSLCYADALAKSFLGAMVVTISVSRGAGSSASIHEVISFIHPDTFVFPPKLQKMNQIRKFSWDIKRSAWKVSLVFCLPLHVANVAPLLQCHSNF